MFWQLGLVLALGSIALLQWRNSDGRSAEDVYGDLLNGSDLERGAEKGAANVAGATSSGDQLTDRLATMGLFGREERRRYQSRRRAMPWVGAMLGALLVAIFNSDGDPVLIVVAAVTAAGFLELVARHGDEARQLAFKRSLEFFLPVVMERLVMAVQAGHDIISGVRVVIELSEHSSSNIPGAQGKKDPVTKLLELSYRLTTRGLRFEEAVKTVAQGVQCPAFRHALVHLGIAYKQGGELIAPLRELADATQLYYQETVEEEIAKLPVKATMPLLLMFAGLVISFMVNPLMTIMETLKSFQIEG